MMNTLNIIIGFITLIGISVYVFKLVKEHKDREKDISIFCNTDNLCGEVIDVAFDKNTGLSRIEVRDASGTSQFGFSRVPAKQLEMLYAGKGYVQIPIIKDRKQK